MKCTVCGNRVNKLEYGRLRIQSVTVINVLNEKVKNKETTMDLTLCNNCRMKISGELINKVLQKPKEAIQNHDISTMEYLMEHPEIVGIGTTPTEENGLPETLEDPNCNHDCANCDGARI